MSDNQEKREQNTRQRGRGITRERGKFMWKVSLIRWSVCPLPEIPSCGAKKRKEKKKRPKLMSLGRSIQLSGLYWEIKSSSLLLFPFAALYDEGWEGGWKEGPRISDVSYCRERRWQVWHLADETMNCLLRPPRPVKRAKQIDALWSQRIWSPSGGRVAGPKLVPSPDFV